ncbi:GNAT family N-acetyltransferase [Gilvimarinus agarilyticus]|uniref:GNAT family N-acetyltransferase n=1 Tax=Gilvimarinus agarilyticus TaxID=679259 RepID=UPI00059FE67F|nr:GNAT family N-acetyltransferase [Gilvimarinus agarilyticus]
MSTSQNATDWYRVSLTECPDYLDQVATWHHRECIRQGLQSRPEVRRERLLQHLTGAASVPHTWLALTRSNAQLIGCVSVVSYHLGARPGTPDTDTPLWLSSLFVLPDYRGQGVASDLIGGVLKFAGQLGMPSLWLTATDQSEFYRRQGWQLVRRAKLGGRWVNVMNLELSETLKTLR